MNAKLIEIFRPGTYTTASGKQVTYTDADIEELYSTYDPSFYRAPFTTDHKADGPAHGYVSGLIKKGNRLFVKFSDMAQELQAATKDRFGRLSVEIWPKVGDKGKYLKAVSLLGVKVPAVKGLEIFECPVVPEQPAESFDFEMAAPTAELLEITSQSYTERPEGATAPHDRPDSPMPGSASPAAGPEGGDGVANDFSAPEVNSGPGEAGNTPADLTARLRALEAENSRLRQQSQAAAESFAERDQQAIEAEARLNEIQMAQRKLEFEQYLNEKIAWGQMPPKMRNKVLKLMQALDSVQLFSEGQPENADTSPLELFQSLLAEMKPVVSFSEAATNARAASGTVTPHNFRDVARRAQAFAEQQRGKGIFVSSTDAVRHVLHHQEA